MVVGYTENDDFCNLIINVENTGITVKNFLQSAFFLFLQTQKYAIIYRVMGSKGLPFCFFNFYGDNFFGRTRQVRNTTVKLLNEREAVFAWWWGML